MTAFSANSFGLFHVLAFEVMEIIKIQMAIKFLLNLTLITFPWLLDFYAHMFNNNAKFLKNFHHLQTLNFIKLRPFEEHTK